MAPGAHGHKGRFQPCHLFRAVICLLADCLSVGRSGTLSGLASVLRVQELHFVSIFQPDVGSQPENTGLTKRTRRAEIRSFRSVREQNPHFHPHRGRGRGWDHWEARWGNQFPLVGRSR